MTEVLQVGVLGASSLVGRYLLPRLVASGRAVQAFSRRARSGAGPVAWRQLPRDAEAKTQSMDCWICLAPLWTVPEHFAMLEASGVRRLVVLSSTSRFTKSVSGDAAEVAIARRLVDAEDAVTAWAERQGIRCVILRPTLIYGGSLDKNVAEIARFIRRFGFFPVLGAASGMRQPVHADDVAAACVAALDATQVQGAYAVSGQEVLSYRAMVERVFRVMGRSPRLVSVPLWMFRSAVTVLRILPRCRHWSTGMAERMNRDQVFDHGDARRDLGFHPRPFLLAPEDVGAAGGPAVDSSSARAS